MTETESRIIALESTIAEMEIFQQDLSETVAEQWRIIDGLQKSLERMGANIEILEDRIDSPAKEAAPPHY